MVKMGDLWVCSSGENLLCELLRELDKVERLVSIIVAGGQVKVNVTHCPFVLGIHQDLVHEPSWSRSDVGPQDDQRVLCNQAISLLHLFLCSSRSNFLGEVKVKNKGLRLRGEKKQS